MPSKLTRKAVLTSDALSLNDLAPTSGLYVIFLIKLFQAFLLTDSILTDKHLKTRLKRSIFQNTLFLAEECLGGQWTRWFNTDNPLSPTGELRKGDLETLDRARLESRRVCAHPLSFKVSLEDGTNVSDSPDTINYILTGPTMGITCFNGEQAGCQK